MKKIFTLIAAAMMAVCANAQEQQAVDYFSAWGSSCTIAEDGKTYSFDGSWAGAGTYVFNDEANTAFDASDFDYFVVTYEEHTGGDLNVGVTYNHFESEASWGKVYTTVTSPINAVSGYAAIQLDQESKADNGGSYAEEIRQFQIQDAGKAGSVKITGIYLMDEDAFTALKNGTVVKKDPYKALDLTNLGSGWGDATYDAATKTITYVSDWTGKGWWLSDVDYSDFDKLVVKFAEPLSGACNLAIEYVETSLNATVSVAAGTTEVEAPLDAAGKGHVKQIYIQNGEGVTKVVLADAFVCTNDYYTVSGINEVKAASAAQKAVKAVKNGKVVIVKNGAEYNVAGQLVK